MRLNKKRREKSRIILLKYLEDIFEKESKENFKFKTWDKLRDVIAEYIESDESDENDMEEMGKTTRSYLPSFLKKFIKKLA